MKIRLLVCYYLNTINFLFLFIANINILNKNYILMYEICMQLLDLNFAFLASFLYFYLYILIHDN